MAADPLDIAHLLRRTEFVARPQRMAELAGRTLAEAVDNVLDLSANGNPQLPDYLQSEDTSDGWNQYVVAVDWWFSRMTSAPRPFQEKMALFWHGHFTSAWYEVDKGYQMMSQNQLYRQQALGDFRELTQRMAIEPAMLAYLSNATNKRMQPNQNFARELMELFTLGVGNYNEADVDAAARAWTGHNYDWRTRRYVFDAAQHDSDQKTFFGITKAWDGPQIIDEILRDNPAKRLVAARFIATKLWEFLAHPNPDAGLVDSLAVTFVQSGMNIGALARAMLNRPEFYSVQTKQGLLRTPIDYVAALSFASGLSAGDIGAAWRLAAAGQSMYQPPNVAGWKANGYWLNASALSARADFADNVAWKLAGLATFDPLASLGDEAAIDTAAAMFGLTPALGRALSDSTRRAVLAWRPAETNGYFRKRHLLLMMMVSPEMNLA